MNISELLPDYTESQYRVLGVVDNKDINYTLLEVKSDSTEDDSDSPDYGLALVKTENEISELLLVDNSIFPLPDIIPNEVAQKLKELIELNISDHGFFPEISSAISPDVLKIIQANLAQQKTIQEKIYYVAQQCVDQLSSKNAPDTNGGRLACAWAVNYVVRIALGKDLGGDLGTSVMIQRLTSNKRYVEVNQSQATAGTIIISPTTQGRIGHVGIVGENSKIYSNSSAAAMWKQNRTFQSWYAYYQDKQKLSVRFFNVLYE